MAGVVHGPGTESPSRGLPVAVDGTQLVGVSADEVLSASARGHLPRRFRLGDLEVENGPEGLAGKLQMTVADRSFDIVFADAVGDVASVRCTAPDSPGGVCTPIHRSSWRCNCSSEESLLSVNSGYLDTTWLLMVPPAGDLRVDKPPPGNRLCAAADLECGRWEGDRLELLDVRISDSAYAVPIAGVERCLRVDGNARYRIMCQTAEGRAEGVVIGGASIFGAGDLNLV